MPTTTPHVAIIGAGLSGLSLAIALDKQSIPCTVYESRPAPLNIGGAIMLSPNALKILDALHVYERARVQGYNFEILHYRNGDGDLQDTQEFGGEEKYGYKGLRIYRHVLIDELLAMVAKKNIPIKYGMKFTKIVSETDENVTWEFDNGETQTASILVGADGIHSTVRSYLYPDLVPKFTGLAATTASVPTAQLKLPAGYHIPVTIVNKYAGFVIAPQQVDGSEVLIGKQRRVEDQDRAGWERVFADKEASVKFLQQDADKFPEFVQNATANISHDKINVWPFYIVPKLDRWSSERRRVVILGDAAHAIPPSAGQGINQAFEDVYMFSLLLAKADKVPMEDALTFWQHHRQQRVDKILELNKQIDLRRMPETERAKLTDAGLEELDLSWLFEPDYRKVVEDWLTSRNA